MSNLQACIWYTYHVSQMVDQEKASMGQVAMSKAYVTSIVREICKWGREILGGNGITFDNYVMKALVDIEGIYTYEGTYDINTLVAGRELTGISAI
jgi:acyl-CoA oxidase